MKGFRVLLIVALAFVTLAGLTAHSARAANTDTIILGTTDTPDSLDNASDYDFHGWELLSAVGEGLLKYKSADSTDIVPGLATDMPKVSADGVTMTFTLKDNLTFADGTPITAQTFVDSIKRVQTLKGDVAGLVTGYVDSVAAPDPKTVVFTLVKNADGKTAAGLMPKLMVLPCYFPVNPATYKADALNKFPTSINGNGPYVLTSYKDKEQAVFAANPKYNGDQPKTKNVIVRYFTDEAQLAAAVEQGSASGGVDIAFPNLAIPDLVRLKTSTAVKVYSGATGSIRYITFNAKTKPVSDVRVRQAIAYLIDRDALIDQAYQGQAQALYSQVLPSLPYATTSFKDMYNSPQPDKAAALLKDAGYTADNPLNLEFWTPLKHYGDAAQTIGDVVKSELEKTGLIKVTLKTAEWATYNDTVSKGGYYMFLFGWFPDYVDPDDYTTYWADSTKDSSGNATNASSGTAYDNPDMNALLSTGRTSTDDATRGDAYKKAQDLWAKDVITLPLLIVNVHSVAGNNVVGADKINPLLMLDLSVLGFSS